MRRRLTLYVTQYLFLFTIKNIVTSSATYLAHRTTKNNIKSTEPTGATYLAHHNAHCKIITERSGVNITRNKGKGITNTTPRTLWEHNSFVKYSDNHTNRKRATYLAHRKNHYEKTGTRRRWSQRKCKKARQEKKKEQTRRKPSNSFSRAGESPKRKNPHIFHFSKSR